MAETVGQHSVAAFTSPVNGTSPIDANTVKGNDNTIRSAYVDHDADPGIHVQSSTLASRPVANSAGRKWMTQDSGVIRLFYDDGTSWYEIDYLRTTGGTISGNLAITGTLSVTGVATLTAQPILSSLTASQAVFTDASKGLVSNAITGTGNVVMSASPTLTGTITAAAATLSGALGVSGLLTFASLKGTGATTVTNILDEDNMASDSATALATQQSIKAYVDAQVGASDALSEVLAIGNTTGANDIIVSAGQKIRTPAVAAQDGSSAITIANTTGALTLATALADSNLATISTAGKVSNSATTAASANTASAIVARDSSGNFSAGTITSALSGNASTATALQTARTINGVSFDGTANITVTAAAGTLTGSTLASGVTASSLTSVGTLASLTVTNPITGSVTGSSGSTTGNAATATALQTARNINGVSFNGTADITVTAAAGTLTGTTLASGVTASSLTSVGTLSSLTVSGDLTVDTSTLKVDSTNNRVGIGTASPGFRTTIEHNFPATFTNAAGDYATMVRSGGTSENWLGVAGQTTTDKWVGLITNGSPSPSLVFGTGGSVQMRLDTSGNLAVDTNTLYVDAANNRVGVGTATPGYTLDSVSGDGNLFRFDRSGVQIGAFVSATNPFFGTLSNNPLLFMTNSTERMRLDASGNLGIGTTSPASRLDVTGAFGTSTTAFTIYNSTASSASNIARIDFRTVNSFSGNERVAAVWGINPNASANNGGALVFGVSANGTSTTPSEVARFDQAGNLGLGVTPSAWDGIFRAQQIGLGAFIAGRTDIYTQVQLGCNAYYDDADNRWEYASNAQAARYYQNSGQHIWDTASGGAAGTAVTWTQAMTLDASGNLLVGETSPVYLSRATFAYSASSNNGPISVDTRAYNVTPVGAFYMGGKYNTAGNYRAFAGIAGVKANTTDGNSEGVLTFQVNNNAADPVERARITSGGEFVVGATATVNSAITSIVATASTNVLSLKNGDNGNYFLYCASTANAERLRIEGDGDVYNLNGTYGTISDERVKQDIVNAPSQWDDIKAVRFRKFRMKSDVEANPDAPFMLGVVAQEIEQTSPGLVDEHPDFEEQEVTDEDGNVTTEKVQVGTTKSVKSSILLMKAAVALQEAMARIESLEARLAALES